MFKAKVVMVGPAESGKTVLSNYLSEASDSIVGAYHPTQGCRIVEFECTNIMVNKRERNAEVELWDCSGDPRHEGCWPAISLDSNGVVFVFNPQEANYDKDLEQWYRYFVQQQGLKDTQCLALANCKESRDPSRPQLSSLMVNVPMVKVCLQDDGDTIREEFNNFLSNILVTMSANRDQQERDIMNS